jgi:hypothetical protein
VRPARRSICLHQHRNAIDAKLLASQPQHVVAAEHSVSRDALSRHFLRHLSAHSADQAPAVPGEPPQVDVIGSVADLQGRVMRLLQRAETARDLRGALAAVREAAGLLTLLGKLQGIIAADGTRVAVQVNKASNPAVVEATRERILAKLSALAGGRVTEAV